MCQILLIYIDSIMHNIVCIVAVPLPTFSVFFLCYHIVLLRLSEFFVCRSWIERIKYQMGLAHTVGTNALDQFKYFGLYIFSILQCLCSSFGSFWSFVRCLAPRSWIPRSQVNMMRSKVIWQLFFVKSWVHAYNARGNVHSIFFSIELFNWSHNYLSFI